MSEVEQAARAIAAHLEPWMPPYGTPVHDENGQVVGTVRPVNPSAVHVREGHGDAFYEDLTTLYFLLLEAPA